jgi:hypothetical protein
MFKAFFVTSFAVLVMAWASASRSAPQPELPEIKLDADPAEPTPGDPRPSGPTESPSRFKPHDTGGPAAEWKYDDLTPRERAVVDRGRDTAGWREVHDAYQGAVLGRVSLIKAHVASSRLGLEHLDTIGVVR